MTQISNMGVKKNSTSAKEKISLLADLFFLFLLDPLQNSPLLRRGKSSPLPFCEVSEHDVLDADTLQLLHITADNLDHTADLSVLPFSECDRKLGR